MEFNVISPYCGLHMEGETVKVFYLESEDLAREYVFGNVQDAQEFCNAAKNLDSFMINVPKGKEELYHLEFLEQIIKDIEYELIVHEAIPADEQAAS
ncbi:hypothetical protein SDC9_83058 [bioreactor metagenome]|uniref:Uncharacterized protein n=1 Tax=bioreactor metagenome TaxID=1076179 RepID=A0A644Z8Z3_9ZZZZ